MLATFQNQHRSEEVKNDALTALDSVLAFQAIYQQHRHFVYHLALRYLKSRELAQEAVQDVFMEIWAASKPINSQVPVETLIYEAAKANILKRLKEIATKSGQDKQLTPSIADNINQNELAVLKRLHFLNEESIAKVVNG